MTERDRQRRLHVENRLEELKAKHGQLEEPPMPPWLDTLEGWQAQRAAMLAQRAQEPPPPLEPTPEPPAPRRAPGPPSRPRKREVWDR